MDRAILHIDCNCFYASVEMLYHPEFRDKPLAVGGDPEARHGIVLTANYIAKRRFGVKTGMALWQAKEVCPDIVFLPPRMDLYLRFSRELREMYGEYTDLIEPFGCDEAWIDVTHSRSIRGSEERIAEEIRQRVKDEFGITVSIGVSFNKIISKLGSDYKKPDAVTDMRRDVFRQKVWPLPASDLLYVGRATEKKLAKIGINTIGELANTELTVLHSNLGVWGDTLWGFANGYDTSPVKAQDHCTEIKSIGNSVTTFRDLTCFQDAKIVLYILSESVSARLRKHGFRCRTIEISVRDNGLVSFTRQKKMKFASDSMTEIAEAAVQLFRISYNWQAPIRSLGVRGCDLVNASYAEQLDLFTSQEYRDKLGIADRAVDDIRRRFGFYSVQRGLMLEDPRLAHINAEEDHTVHPVGYF